MEHAQTASYYHSLKDVLLDILIDMAPVGGARVLELGLDWGISARAFLEDNMVASVTSVDINHRPEVDAIITETGRANRFQFVQMRTDDYFKLPIEGAAFDLIFIDADHTYQQVKKDLQSAWERLEPGGWIIMHDVLHKGHFDGRPDAYGVAQAVIEHVADHQIEATITAPYPGLAYFRKPTK